MNTVIARSTFASLSVNSATKQFGARAPSRASSEGSSMTDGELYELCKKYGEIALKYRRRFLGLLPEVYKRRLYEKKGFSSIFEFAAKLAGISEEQVRVTLNLEKRLEDKPILKSLLVNGEVGVNKLVRVASIATPENQEFWANQVQLLPKSAIDTLVRDERFAKRHEGLSVHSNLSQNGEDASADGTRHYEQSKAISNKSANFSEIDGSEKLASLSLRGAKQRSNLNSSFTHGELNLSEEVQQKLLELRNKGIDINQLILEFLKKRKESIQQEKERIGEEQRDNLIEYNITETPYIRAKIRNILKQEYGKKCSIPRCNKPWSEIHHTQRFSLAKIHDPRYMAPLCEEHHAIAHSIDVKVQEKKRR